MIYESERWIRILKRKNTLLTQEEREYIKLIETKANNYLRENKLNQRYSRKVILMIGAILERNDSLQQACINLKQDLQRVTHMKFFPKK